jgi:putative hemolysin
MGEITFEIIFIIILLIANGVFSMSEMAVVSARKARLQKRASDGEKGARAALELAENPGSFLSTVQIGITLVGILAGAFGGATIAEKLAPLLKRFPAFEPYADNISFGLVVLVRVRERFGFEFSTCLIFYDSSMCRVHPIQNPRIGR